MTNSNAHSLQPLFRLIVTLIIQLAAFACSVVVFKFSENIFVSFIASTVLCALLSKIFSLPKAWALINIALPTCIAITINNHISATPFMLLCVGLLVLFLPTLTRQVPFYPTQRQLYFEVLQQLPHRDLCFIDLGCGSAALISFLASKLPDSKFVGIELSPLAYLAAYARKVFLGQKNLQILFGDFWKLDLAQYDVVYAFLSPEPMPRLHQKYIAETKQRSLAIINSFPFPAEHQHETAEFGARKQKLYVYKREV